MKKLKEMKSRTRFTLLAMFMIVAGAIVDVYMTARGTPIDASKILAWNTVWTTELALLFGIKIKDKGQ